MDINQQLRCNLCGGQFSVLEILGLAERYWPELDVLMCKSPCCQSPEELRLTSGTIERGYVYAAGCAHFAGMVRYKVPGLRVSKASQAISFNLGGTEETITAKT